MGFFAKCGDSTVFQRIFGTVGDPSLGFQCNLYTSPSQLLSDCARTVATGLSLASLEPVTSFSISISLIPQTIAGIEEALNKYISNEIYILYGTCQNFSPVLSDLSSHYFIKYEEYSLSPEQLKALNYNYRWKKTLHGYQQTHYLMVFVPVTLCKLASSIFHQCASYVPTSHCDDIRKVIRARRMTQR